MADVTVDAAVQAGLETTQQPRNLVWTSPTTGYLFFLDSSNDLHYRKTTDSGASWATEVTVEGVSTSQKGWAIWFDKWTDGTGDLIHIVSFETQNDDFVYRNLDTSTDTLLDKKNILVGSTFGSASWSLGCVSIVKSRDGRLYAGGFFDPSGENGVWESDDVGVNWSSIADPCEGNEVDRVMFTPGNSADSKDFFCIYWDVSANQIDLKVYDESGDSWSTTNITSAVENAAYFGMDAVHRQSDNHTILTCWNANSSSLADIECWDITDAGTITAKTDVITGHSTYAVVGLMINQQNDDLYCCYSDGTTLGGVFYQLSQDGGASWDGETAMSETDDDHKNVVGGTSVGNEGGRWQPVWFNDDNNDLMTSTVNAISIAVYVPTSDTNVFLQIGDDFKAVAGVYVNRGDVFKGVSGAYINQGDSWKTIFS